MANQRIRALPMSQFLLAHVRATLEADRITKYLVAVTFDQNVRNGSKADTRLIALQSPQEPSSSHSVGGV